MAKKSASQRAPILVPSSVSAEMSVEEILAAPPPAAPRRRTRRDTAKSLGVYDAERDILDQYLHEVSLTPLLTQEPEIAIARRVQAGDEEAREIAGAVEPHLQNMLCRSTPWPKRMGTVWG